MRRWLATVLAAAAICGSGCSGPPAPRLFVLGIDGMDPQILRRLIDAGRMPNFAALAQAGGMTPLATTMPPQSPVAWSSFITGLRPAGHGIFDFVHREAHGLQLYLSTSRVDADGHMALRRLGTPFWDLLLQAGVPATIFRVPANFPPSPAPAGIPWGCGCSLRAFAGMGTPDLLGTYGTFTLFTDGDYRVPDAVDGGGDVLVPGTRLDVPGGRVVSLQPRRGTAPLALDGPEIDGRVRRVEGRLHIDGDAVHLALPGADLVLRAGEWSPWVALDFGRRPGGLGRVAAITRFHLRGTSPLWLYAAPLNLDPREPMMPLSVPDGAAAELAEGGLYYTQGMPADTKALEAAAFDEAEFLEQVELTLREREAQLDEELARFDRGLLFFYVHSLDQVSHVLWRAADAAHPGHAASMALYAGAIDDHYERMDRLLGRALAGLRRADAGAAQVLVLSDHGFAPFARAVNLNRWLADHGYLVLAADGAASDLLQPGAVDWSRTRAYALGLNAIYLNRRGREDGGIVGDAEAPDLRRQLAADLEGMRDPRSGAPVVVQVYDVEAAADLAALAPDLLVGYARGYRSSGASAVGRVDPDWIADNLSAWSGDHCMAAEVVPGVLLSSRRFAATAPALWDIPVSILSFYGVAPPAGAAGRAIW